MTHEKDALPSAWIEALRQGYEAGLYLAAIVFVDSETCNGEVFSDPGLDRTALAYVLRTAAADMIEGPSEHPSGLAH